MGTVRGDVELSLLACARRGYYAGRFRRMWAERPTLQMLEEMVVTPDIQTGLKLIAKLGLLEHSVEQIVINHSKNPSIIAAAKWRLEQVRGKTH